MSGTMLVMIVLVQHQRVHADLLAQDATAVWHVVNAAALAAGAVAALFLSIMGLVSFDAHPVQHNMAASVFQGGAGAFNFLFAAVTAHVDGTPSGVVVWRFVAAGAYTLCSLAIVPLVYQEALRQKRKRLTRAVQARQQAAAQAALEAASLGEGEAKHGLESTLHSLSPPALPSRAKQVSWGDQQPDASPRDASAGAGTASGTVTPRVELRRQIEGAWAAQGGDGEAGDVVSQRLQAAAPSQRVTAARRGSSGSADGPSAPGTASIDAGAGTTGSGTGGNTYSDAARNTHVHRTGPSQHNDSAASMPLEPALRDDEVDAAVRRASDAGGRGSLSVHLSASEIVSFSTVGPVNALRGFDSAKEVVSDRKRRGGKRARGVPLGLKVWAALQYLCLASELVFVASFGRDFASLSIVGVPQ